MDPNQNPQTDQSNPTFAPMPSQPTTNGLPIYSENTLPTTIQPQPVTPFPAPPQPQSVQQPTPFTTGLAPQQEAPVVPPTQEPFLAPQQPQIQPQPVVDSVPGLQQPIGYPQQPNPQDPQLTTQAPAQPQFMQPTVLTPQQPSMTAAIPQPQPIQQPMNPALVLPQRLREPSKKLSMVMAIVFILLSFGMGGFSFRVLQIRKKEGAKVAAIDLPTKLVKEEIKKVGKPTQDRPDGTLDLATTFDPYNGAHDQDIKAKIGQQVNTSNGLSFIVTNVSPWTSSDKYIQPKNGKKFVRINLILGNRSTKRIDATTYGWGIKEGASGKTQDDAAPYISNDDEDSFNDDEYYLGDYKDGIDSQKSIKAILIMEVSSTEANSLVYSNNPYGRVPGEKDEDYPESQDMKIKVEITL